jgi:ABC-type methionine transport system ATPase subunit
MDERHPGASAPNPEASASPPLFALRQVSQQRGGTAVLREVTLDLPRTAITALVGPSGAGKTSLLRLLNRLGDPSGGEISFNGRPITSYPIGALRRRVGFVFQTASMFPGTVADNLAVAVALRETTNTGLPAPPDPLVVLDAVGLDATYAGREAARLSGGEQQRVGIARALMTRPEVLLLDEPTAALDPEVAERLLATIAGLTREHGVSVVMVTHRLAEARQVSTYTVMLEAGRIVESGPSEQLFGAATNARARTYLASAD